MKHFRIIGAACAALYLSACSVPALAPYIGAGPAPIAQATVLDEKGAIMTEEAYAFAVATTTRLIRAGVFKTNAELDRVVAIRNRAKAARDAVRAAYEAGNAANYASAFAQAQAVIAEFRNVIK